MTERAGPPALDARRLYEEIEHVILGSARSLTRVQVAEAADVPLDRAIALWRALGFPAAQGDDDVLFVDRDIEALRLFAWLVESGFIDPAVELTIVRSIGRSFARLAEWEVAELAEAGLEGSIETDQARLEEMIVALVPVVEDIQNYVWRRHMAHAAGRLLLFPTVEDSTLTVGFVDIVGFTRRSREMTGEQLTELIDSFEALCTSVITENNGRVIKNIGDEMLFVTDEPEEAARIALELVDAQEAEEFPDVRIGLAHGDVVTRLGDVFGPVVNVASRLTSLCRPRRVLIDRGLAHELKDLDGEFRVRRSRTATVRGYARLDTFTLKRPKMHD